MSLKQKKRVIAEVFLILIIIVQAFVIFYFYSLLKTKSFAMLGDMACVGTTNYIFSFSEKEEFEELIGIGEYLFEGGYEDKPFFHELAIAYFMVGNEKKAAEFLEKALSAKTLCKILRPTNGTSIALDEALARFQLSEIYSLLGKKEQLQKEYSAAQNLLKVVLAERYSPTKAENILKKSSLIKAREELFAKSSHNP